VLTLTRCPGSFLGRRHRGPVVAATPATLAERRFGAMNEPASRERAARGAGASGTDELIKRAG
jgi:hypothetical protein